MSGSARCLVCTSTSLLIDVYTFFIKIFVKKDNKAIEIMTKKKINVIKFFDRDNFF